MKLQNSVTLAVGVILLLIGGARSYISFSDIQAHTKWELETNARSVANLLKDVWRENARLLTMSGTPPTQDGPRPFHVIPRIADQAPPQLTGPDGGFTFNITIDRPHNRARQADESESDLLTFFRNRPGATEHAMETRSEDGIAHYQYSTPLRIEQYCLACHNDTDQSTNTGYRIGDVLGILRITIPMTHLHSQAWSNWRVDMISRLIAIMLLALSLIALINWLITRRLSALERIAAAITAGDFSQRAIVEGSDEISLLAAALNRATDTVQKRNADLKRFSEISAHHLREPARRLLSYAEHLEKQLAHRLDDAEATLALNVITREARHQQNLVRDIERYQAADQPHDETKFCDTNHVVRELLTDLADKIREANAEITVGDLPGVFMDVPRLIDIFSVPLENALQHGRVIGKPLHIAITGERKGNAIRYCISDNGPGIETEYRERVFRVFERLSSTGENTGIGLAILRRIAENTGTGGGAWIEEAPDSGCRVVIELPATNTP